MTGILLEGPDQPPLLVLGPAGPRVLDFEAQELAIAFLRSPGAAKNDPADRGELDGVAEQVDEHLGQLFGREAGVGSWPGAASHDGALREYEEEVPA